MYHSGFQGRPTPTGVALCGCLFLQSCLLHTHLDEAQRRAPREATEDNRRQSALLYCRGAPGCRCSFAWAMVLVFPRDVCLITMSEEYLRLNLTFSPNTCCFHHFYILCAGPSKNRPLDRVHFVLAIFFRRPFNAFAGAAGGFRGRRIVVLRRCDGGRRRGRRRVLERHLQRGRLGGGGFRRDKARCVRASAFSKHIVLRDNEPVPIRSPPRMLQYKRR